MKMKLIGTVALVLGLTVTVSYAQKPRPKPATSKQKVTSPARTGSLDLEAGLIFNSGDVKPVGRATFYLIKADGKTVLLTQDHFNLYTQDTARFGLPKSFDKWSLYEAVLYMDGRIAPTFAAAAKKDLEAAAVSQSTTGFDGKATFSDVPAGDYFVFGYYSFGKQTTYWNVPVTIKPGSNKLVLDNDNMQS